jgi:hypothetical protein
VGSQAVDRTAGQIFDFIPANYKVETPSSIEATKYLILFQAVIKGEAGSRWKKTTLHRKH